MTTYPTHIFPGIFNPLLRIQHTLFCDLNKNFPDLTLITYTDVNLDEEDIRNMMGIYQIPENKVIVLPKQDSKEKLKEYMEHANIIFSSFYNESEKLLFFDSEFHSLFSAFLQKVHWIEIAEEHKHISTKKFWEDPEQNQKWVHPDVFTLFIKNRILI